MTPSDAPRPFNRRAALATLGLGVFAPNVLAACGGTTATQAEKKEQPAPQLKYQPANAADNVVPIVPVSVEVDDGWFQRVALTNSSGKVVAGAFNQDRTVFTATEPLGYDQTYTWGGSAVGHDGKAVPVTGKFTTVSPTKKIGGAFQLADGQTVGVAAPIIIQFDAPISDKAAVEKALTVTTTPPVEGSWAWLPDEAGGARVHWRTREYYPAGTTVNVDAKLYGVPFGDGAYGADDISLDFQIGRRQLVKAEVSSHRIQVVTDEGVIMDLPCSYGEADKARNVTRSGIHVVTEKYADFYMSNPAAGYSQRSRTLGGPDLQQRRVHPRQPGERGRPGQHQRHQRLHQPVDRRRRAVLHTAIYGDPVEVTGSSIQLSYSDGDIWDWAVDWDTWVAMSALPPPTAHPPSPDPGHRARHAIERADPVGHPDHDDDTA